MNDHINQIVGIADQKELVNPQEFLNSIIGKLKKTIFFMLSDNELLWEQVERMRKTLGTQSLELKQATSDLETARTDIREKDTEITVLRREKEKMQDKHLDQRLEAIQEKKALQ